jgi:hypothetical protein
MVLPTLRAPIAFVIAAAAEILIIGVITAGWPEKVVEGAVPIAIIVCGLVGPHLGEPWYRVALLGAVLGLLNAAVCIALSSTLDVPEKFTVAERIAVSIGFSAATASATWLWVQFERRRGRT